MPVDFDSLLTAALRKDGWRVKIREKETREPPHVSILRGRQAWRIDLRTREFMDRKPDPSDVPAQLVKRIKDEKAWKQICDAWDRKYPKNPVGDVED